MCLCLLLCPVGSVRAQAKDETAADKLTQTEVENRTQIQIQQSAIQRLVVQLQSETLAERNAAQRQLIKFGPQALPLLPADRDVSDSATRSSLALIRQSLWQQKAATSVTESRVELSGEMTVGEFLKTVEQQSGNSIVKKLGANLLEKPLNITAQECTFWESLSELEGQTSVRVSIAGQPKSLSLVDSQVAARPVQLAGPFRIELTSIGVRDVIGEDDLQLLRLRFLLMTEPRLRPLFLTRTGKSLSVTADDGRTVSPYSPAANVELSLGHHGMQVEFHSDFVVDRDSMPQSVDINGAWRMQLAGGQEPFEFALAASSAGARRTKAGVTVGLEQLVQTADHIGPLVNVVVSVSYHESGKAFESHRNWLGKNDIYLTGDGIDGADLIRPDTMQIELQVDGSAYVRYQFRPKKSRPTRIVFSAPTLITEVVVPVRFDNQSLPAKK